MATTITNKTRKPLSVPLARNKVLYLGPGKSGQIASSDAEHPRVKALAESGAIELVEAGSGHAAGGGPDRRGGSAHGHAAGGGIRRSGDR